MWFSFVSCQCHIFDGTSGNTRVCRALCCTLSTRLYVEVVLIILQSESCFLPQEDDPLSALPVAAWERRLPSKVTSHSASRWLNDANTGLKMLHIGPNGYRLGCWNIKHIFQPDSVLEMNKMICKKFWTLHKFLLWNENKIWCKVLCWCGFSLNFDLPYFSAEVLLI